MGLSSGYMGQQTRTQRPPGVWGAAIFGGGITVVALAVYGSLSGVNLASTRALSSAALAITLAFAAHYLVAKLRTRRGARA